MFSFVTGCNYTLYDYSDEDIKSLIVKNIDVVIPDEAILEKRYHSPVNLVGRLPKYYIYNFEDEPTAFLEEYNLTEDRDKYIEDEIYDYLLGDNRAYKLNIVENDLLNFEEKHLLVYKVCNYCLFYYVDTKQLIVYILSK